MRPKTTSYQQPFSNLPFTKAVCILLAIQASQRPHFKDWKIQAQKA